MGGAPMVSTARSDFTPFPLPPPLLPLTGRGSRADDSVLVSGLAVVFLFFKNLSHGGGVLPSTGASVVVISFAEQWKKF